MSAGLPERPAGRRLTPLTTTLPLQGTVYEKTDAEMEMKKINREEFWEQAKVSRGRVNVSMWHCDAPSRQGALFTASEKPELKVQCLKYLA